MRHRILALGLAALLLIGVPLALAAETGREKGAQPVPATFTDIQDHWAAGMITRAAQSGLFIGYPDGRFGPDDLATRGQLAVVLYRLAGSPAWDAAPVFSDLAGESGEFRQGIAWACETGILTGKDGTRFAPSAPVTRQEAVESLFLYAGGRTGREAMFSTIYQDQFLDSGEIAPAGRAAMDWGVYYELISDAGGRKLAPNRDVTRAELAKMLVSYLNNLSGREGEP